MGLKAYLRRRTKTIATMITVRMILPGQMKNPPLLDTPATMQPVSGSVP
jgi:hypothetical protein